jgi:hypothetical protein
MIMPVAWMAVKTSAAAACTLIAFTRFSSIGKRRIRAKMTGEKPAGMNQ